MRKTLVLVAILSMLTLAAYAVSLTPTLSVSGGFDLTAVVSKAGIDLTPSFDGALSWGVSPDEATSTFGTLTMTVNFSLSGGGTPTVSFASLVWDNPMLTATYEDGLTPAYSDYVFSTASANGVEVAPKGALAGLKFAYLDTVADGASEEATTATYTFFDDDVAVNYSKTLGGIGVNLTGAYYKLETNEYGYAVHVVPDLSGMISGLTANVAFANDLQRTASPAASESGAWKTVGATATTMYAVDAAYSGTFGIVELGAGFDYRNEFTPKYEKFVDTTEDADALPDAPMFADKNLKDVTGSVKLTVVSSTAFTLWVKGSGTYTMDSEVVAPDLTNASTGLSVEAIGDATVGVGPATVHGNVDVTPLASPMGVVFTGDVALDVSPLSVTANVEIDDVLGAATDILWDVTGSLTIPVVDADATVYVEGETATSIAYYASISKTFNDVVTVKGYYGTYSEAAGAHATVLPVDPHWYVEISTAEVSF